MAGRGRRVWLAGSGLAFLVLVLMSLHHGVAAFSSEPADAERWRRFVESPLVHGYALCALMAAIVFGCALGGLTSRNLSALTVIAVAAGSIVFVHGRDERTDRLTEHSRLGAAAAGISLPPGWKLVGGLTVTQLHPPSSSYPDGTPPNGIQLISIPGAAPTARCVAVEAFVVINGWSAEKGECGGHHPIGNVMAHLMLGPPPANAKATSQLATLTLSPIV